MSGCYGARYLAGPMDGATNNLWALEGGVLRGLSAKAHWRSPGSWMG